MKTWILAAAWSLACAACGGPPAAPSPAPPAHVESPVPEAGITTVRFTEEAERRLALETAIVTEGALPAVRLVGGEVVVPPGRAISVTAPVAGVVRSAVDQPILPGSAVHRGDALFRLVPLAPIDRDVRARADREVTAATATLEAAEARVARTEALVAERASSQRVLEEVTAARDVARADLDVADRRARTVRGTPLLSDIALTVRAPDDGIVRLLTVATDQAVAQGAPLVEIVAVDALQIRVPVYAGDLGRIDRTASAGVSRLGARDPSERFIATPVLGPPTADAVSVTVDHFYALAPGALFAVGERVLVELPLLEQTSARTMPWSSIVFDAEGSAWAYECAGEHAYHRVRVDPIRRAGDLVVFARGPAVGACVASVGVSEIFGSEFEPGH